MGKIVQPCCPFSRRSQHRRAQENEERHNTPQPRSHAGSCTVFLGTEKPACAARIDVPPARGWAARRFTLSVTHRSNSVTRARQRASLERSNPLEGMSCPPDRATRSGPCETAGALGEALQYCVLSSRQAGMRAVTVQASPRWPGIQRRTAVRGHAAAGKRSAAAAVGGGVVGPRHPAGCRVKGVGNPASAHRSASHPSQRPEGRPRPVWSDYFPTRPACHWTGTRYGPAVGDSKNLHFHVRWPKYVGARGQIHFRKPAATTLPGRTQCAGPFV
jgi:hypothetical protein